MKSRCSSVGAGPSLGRRATHALASAMSVPKSNLFSTRPATSHSEARVRRTSAGDPKGEAPMSEKEGILRMQSSRRWAMCRPGREPVEITSGEVFRVEVDGKLQVMRMEYDYGGR